MLQDMNILTGFKQKLFPSKSKYCLVSYHIGSKVASLYQSTFDNHKQYANSIGIESFHKTHQFVSKKEAQIHPEPSWWKLLLPSILKQYDLLIVIDSDVIIVPETENILKSIDIDFVMQGKIYGVEVPTGRRDISKARVEEYYRTQFLEKKSHQKLINTGVFILSPNFHSEILLKLFRETPNSIHKQYEMPIFNDYIFSNNFYLPLNPLFNQMYADPKTEGHPSFNDYLRNKGFIHFAGGQRKAQKTFLEMIKNSKL